MKKEAVIWVLLATLFIGEAVLFTLNYSQKSYCKSSRYKHSLKWKNKMMEKHHAIYSELCESCQKKLANIHSSNASSKY
jgi:hypothetical protein